MAERTVIIGSLLVDFVGFYVFHVVTNGKLWNLAHPEAGKVLVWGIATLVVAIIVDRGLRRRAARQSGR